MSAIRVRTHVPENRQVTLTLPQDVPVGDAVLEIVVRESAPVREFTVTVDDRRPQAFPSRPTNPELAAEYDAFQLMLPDLMTRYSGRYVVLLDGNVVAVGDTEIDALTSAHHQALGKLMYVRLVTDQPQPLPRFGSPRLAQETA